MGPAPPDEEGDHMIRPLTITLAIGDEVSRAGALRYLVDWIEEDGVDYVAQFAEFEEDGEFERDTA